MLVVLLILVREKAIIKTTFEKYSRDIYIIDSKDINKNNRWFIKNVKNGNILNKSYMERDLLKISANVVEPNVKLNNKEELQRELKVSRNLKNLNRLLHIAGTNKL